MENIEAMLCAYVEGDLDAAGRAQIEKHLHDHPQHRKLLEELTAMRELVRGLPRAKAPMDVGDSLRQKVERSMLLEDSAAAAPARGRVNRWPQFFGIAAIFLLVASLCFILYKALGPTWKPAVFTQNTGDRMPEMGPAEQPAAPEADVQALAAIPLTAGSDAIAQKAQVFVFQSRQAALQVTQPDLPTIRRRLENSGYGIHGGDVGGGSSAPVLVVVESTDLSATKAQISRFFSGNAGISWDAVPAVSGIKSEAATLPSAAVSAKPTATAGNLADEKEAVESSDLYVARGLTPERADALRQTLMVPRNGSAVQVTVQSAQSLATTQPSAEIVKDIDASKAQYSLRMPTSQPAESGKLVVGTMLAATTAPSFLLNDSRNPSQSLPPVDAVIVLQTAAVPAAAAVPATQPIVTGQTLASPSTQP